MMMHLTRVSLFLSQYHESAPSPYNTCLCLYKGDTQFVCVQHIVKIGEMCGGQLK